MLRVKRCKAKSMGCRSSKWLSFRDSTERLQTFGLFSKVEKSRFLAGAHLGHVSRLRFQELSVA